MSKLIISFDEANIIKDGKNANSAYNEFKKIAEQHGLVSIGKDIYEGGLSDCENGLLDACSAIVNMIEDDAWYLSYINQFKYNDGSGWEDFLDDLQDYLKNHI